ncbi:MAG: hypothetical protein ACPGRC_07235 [Salibacteraceae bacterium]
MKATDTTARQEQLFSSNNKETQLIDLFVDMCFYDIENPAVIFQFKVLATQLKYPIHQIDKVVEIGKKEYAQVFSAIENQIIEAIGS